MSAEDDFFTLLDAHAGLAALVGDRISQNAVPQGTAAPYVAFTSRHELTHNLLGDVVADACTFTVQCWGDGSLQADQVADQVAIAIAAADISKGAAVLSRDTGFDAETGLDATILTVEWWAL